MHVGSRVLNEKRCRVSVAKSCLLRSRLPPLRAPCLSVTGKIVPRGAFKWRRETDDKDRSPDPHSCGADMGSHSALRVNLDILTGVHSLVGRTYTNRDFQ